MFDKESWEFVWKSRKSFLAAFILATLVLWVFMFLLFPRTGSSFVETLMFSLGAALFIGVAITIGTVFGYVARASKFKQVTLAIKFQDKKAFHAKINIELSKLGYYPQNNIDNFWSYRLSAISGPLLSLHFKKDDTCIIIGTQRFIDYLEEQLEKDFEVIEQSDDFLENI